MIITINECLITRAGSSKGKDGGRFYFAEITGDGGLKVSLNSQTVDFEKYPQGIKNLVKVEMEVGCYVQNYGNKLNVETMNVKKVKQAA